MLVGSTRYGKAGRNTDLIKLDTMEWSQTKPHPVNEYGERQYLGAVIYRQRHYLSLLPFLATKLLNNLI